MVFSSLPSYVDPPNWPQQQPAGGLVLGDGSGGGDHEICQLPPPLLPPPLPLGSGGDGRSLQILDPARMTNPTDTAMKCPRCESTNTKFCYFNNYSLSQPRHFCKTCRRYWTRGGALRNVPVGGGCRRNKKSNKGSRVSSRSKSPSATISSINTTNAPTDNILGHLSHNTQSPHFPIIPPLHHFGGGDLGLTYGGGNGSDLFKFSHFPNMEVSNGGMYGEGTSNYSAQLGRMKMEESHQHQQQQQLQEMNLSRNFMGTSGNDQFLGTSNVGWGTIDLTGFTSSSTTTTTHLL